MGVVHTKRIETYAGRRVFVRILGLWFGSYGHEPLQDRGGQALVLYLGLLAAVGGQVSVDIRNADSTHYSTVQDKPFKAETRRSES